MRDPCETLGWPLRDPWVTQSQSQSQSQTQSQGHYLRQRVAKGLAAERRALTTICLNFQRSLSFRSLGSLAKCTAFCSPCQGRILDGFWMGGPCHFGAFDIFDTEIAKGRPLFIFIERGQFFLMTLRPRRLRRANRAASWSSCSAVRRSRSRSAAIALTCTSPGGANEPSPGAEALGNVSSNKASPVGGDTNQIIVSGPCHLGAFVLASRDITRISSQL
jgi:hypothetical protein